MVYGTDSIVPLIGGSGGSAPSDGALPGGAGGGAILIASSGDITLNPTGGIFANGGQAVGGFSNAGAGSGGGIRLVANAVLGSGILLHALGGTTGNDGGDGRIRVDGAKGSEVQGEPEISNGDAGPIFPEAPAPILRATAVNGIPVPVDPLATVFSGDVAFSAADAVSIAIEAQNVPLPASVTVRIVQADGGVSDVSVVDLAGKFELSTATALFDFSAHPPGKWEVHLSVQLP